MLTTRAPRRWLQLLAGRQRQVDLRTGRQQEDVRRSRHRPRPARRRLWPHPRRRRAWLRSRRRQRLTGEDEGGGLVAQSGRRCARSRRPRWRRPGGTREGPGTARNETSCSTGWWVGPSSPTPMESWVKMCRTGISMRAESRMARGRSRRRSGSPTSTSRSLVSAMPLAMAAEACSRMPKWRLRPDRSSGWKSPAPSKMSRVLVEGDRSAEPPRSQGTAWATVLST